MSKPAIKNLKVQKIELQGRHGTFSVPNKGVTVKYFSTAANNRTPGSGEYLLLKELKPMRERVKPSQLDNLNSLLQRDLNDARVANELIPYLNGKTSEIAFFPAILGVLMPQEFITTNGGVYPTPKVSENSDGNTQKSYGKYWDLEIYKAGDGDSQLGILSISPELTDIIVLDGQHRATAFRYASGVIDDSKDIHSAFYHNINTSTDFVADLPVTLIWFEKENGRVDPKLISRNLFVDVNNSAKKVSKSRNILLDDRRATALMTRFFYSFLAQKNSFQSSELSLLHSAFDIDSDLTKSSGNIISITNPEIFEYGMSWFLFGSGTYDNLDRYSVTREKSQKTIAEFSRNFVGDGFNENHLKTTSDDDVILKDISSLRNFESEFESKMNSVLFDLFSKPSFYRYHISATKELEEWVNEQEAAIIEVWEEAYKGGEGLYYTLNYSSNIDSSNNRIKKYRAAISSIESEFSEIRAKHISAVDTNKIDRFYNSLRTKAFQVGYLMAFKVFTRETNDIYYLDSVNQFLNRLDTISAEKWVYIFTTLRSEIKTSLDPKQWPLFQKLILRFIQENEEFYNADNFQYSPEGQIFDTYIKNKLMLWLDSENLDKKEVSYIDLPKNKIKDWQSDSFNSLKKLYDDASLKLIEPDDIENITEKNLKGQIGKTS